MYIPAVFEERDLPKLHAAVERYSFATLVSHGDNGMAASHLPLLLDRDGEKGTLVGHMARANEQWREAAGQAVMAIFSGPHAYVSPSWYEATQVVPTWNYTAVHTCGRVEVIQEEDTLLAILRRTVEVYERAMPRPWSFDDSSSVHFDPCEASNSTMA